MIRRALLAVALALCVAGSAQLYKEVRYLHQGSRTIASLLGGSRGAAVVYVVQPEDCLGSGVRVRSWAAVHADRRVPVRALVVGSGLSPRQRDLFARNDVRLPLGSISLQDAAIVAEKLGYVSTPFAVILDRQGRVAATFPAERNVPPEVVRRLALGE